MAERPRRIEGLVCYSVAWSKDGKIRSALYRPERGPWTPALMRKVPSSRQGIALESEQPGRSGAPGDVTGAGADATATGRATINRGALAAERKAAQGALDL